MSDQDHYQRALWQALAASLLAEIASRLLIGFHQSRLSEVVQISRDTVASSQVIGFQRRGEQVWQHSRTARWLVANPAPSVVTINIRETLFLGMVARALGSLVDVLLRSRDAARVVAFVQTVAAAALHRPIRLTSVIGLLSGTVVVLTSAATMTASPLVAVVWIVLMVGMATGIRSSCSWSEIQQTRLFARVVRCLALFVPGPEQDETERL